VQFGETAGSGIRDVGRGLAAEFASHPGLDYPAFKTHFIIEIIAPLSIYGKAPAFGKVNPFGADPRIVFA
jgi:hypothetical protein